MKSDVAHMPAFPDLSSTLLVHPFRIDLLRDQVMFVELSARELAEASFLDQRILRRDARTAWLGWSDIEQHLANRPRRGPDHYIFHVGHCGSTLISRLIQEAGVPSLREPLPLRTLAEVHAELDTAACRWTRTRFAQRLAITADLFGRGDGVRSIKATSFCNDLAVPLLQYRPAANASIVYTQLRPYLANVLIGPNSRLDILSGAPMRVRRLTARVQADIGRLAEMPLGVVAAMSWVCEMAALAATVDAYERSRIMLIDFDRFLRDVPAELTRLVLHMAPDIDAKLIEAAASSPVLNRYSKAPEHAYDARLRQDVLADGERQFPDEIAAGLRWCEQTAARCPTVARALALFAGA
jgi:hypothetical protein